jgi:competence protein ComEC
VIGALALLGGVLLGLSSADIPGLYWLLSVAGLLVAWRASSWRHHPASACAAWWLAGQLLASAHAHHWMQRSLTGDARVLAEGRIVSVPERDGATLRFDLRTDLLEGVSRPGTARLVHVLWRDAAAEPRVGERWRLLLKLLPREETRNFAGVDSARLAFRAGVHGSARVLPSALNDLLRLAPARLDTLRARIAARIRDSVADPDAAARISALAVGVTGGMSRDQWRVFNATGATHLVAISGMHVTLFAWLAFRAARLAWRFAGVWRFVGREPFTLLCGLAAAGGYSLLAGLSVPTLRTWLMLALYVGARLWARRVDAGRLWAMALMLVLLTDARAPLAAGFWLSFIAVGVLLAFAGGEAGPRWSAAVRVQLLVMLALIPASLAIFGGVSLVGLAVNLVAIPVISLGLVPLVLAGAFAAGLAPAFGAPFFAMAGHFYDWLWPAMTWCADTEVLPALWRVSPPLAWYLLALPASLVWLCRGPWSMRLTASCALLPLVFAASAAPEVDRARIDVLDAGRGSAMLVRTRHHALLFDTGDAWNTHGARLAQIVLPALDAGRIPRVDRLILPTLDADRARGTALLAGERGLDEAWFGHGGSGNGWPGSGLAVRCRNSRWIWDGVRFEAYSRGRFCLLRVSVAGTAMLLTGDLDAPAERALVARAGASLASDVVVMGRQASEAASSPQWIESTSPGLAIATGGVDGAQSRQRVIARWRAHGSRVLDTRREGAVALEISARGVVVLGVARTSRFPFHWRRPV